MAKSKAKTVFFCKECGYETPKWMGQCPGCHQWNTMTEEKVSPMSKGTGKRGDNLPRQELTGLFEVSMEEEDRSSSGIPELDRVLGGGIVKGSLTLVGGDPGIGKSTLLLQICRYQANSGKKVVYVSGEESLKQIKMRAQRLGGFKQNVFLLCETDINAAAEAVREAKPDMVVVDSVQTMYSEEITSAAGSVKLNFQPGAPVRDDAEGVKQFPVQVLGAFKANARGTVKLGHDDAFGAVDDKGAAVGHHGEFPHINRFFLGLVVGFELEGDLKGGAVGFPRADGLVIAHLRLFNVVGDEVELNVFVIALDRKDFLQNAL